MLNTDVLNDVMFQRGKVLEYEQNEDKSNGTADCC